MPAEGAMLLEGPPTVPAGEGCLPGVCPEVAHERGLGGEGTLALDTGKGWWTCVCAFVHISGTLRDGREREQGQKMG